MKSDIEFLDELCDYARYLYEQEEVRSERFHGAMKTYLLFIGSTLAGSVGTIKWIGLTPSILKNSSSNFFELAIVILLLIALFTLIVSFVFAILVIKVWRTEKLCSPKELAVLASLVGLRSFLLENRIANYIIAAERNGRVNDHKARFLALASVFYRAGLVFLFLSAILYLGAAQN